MAACPHPPSRLYVGWAKNDQLQDEMWIACCECGAVLRGGATLEQPESATDLQPAAVAPQEGKD